MPRRSSAAKRTAALFAARNQSTEVAKLSQALAASQKTAARERLENAEIKSAIEASKAFAEEEEALALAIRQSKALSDSIPSRRDSNFSSSTLPAVCSRALPHSLYSSSTLASGESLPAALRGEFMSISSTSNCSSTTRWRSTEEDGGLAMILHASALAAEAEEAALAQAIAASLATDERAPAIMVEAANIADPMSIITPLERPDSLMMCTVAEHPAKVSGPNAAPFVPPAACNTRADVLEVAMARVAKVQTDTSADWFEEESDGWIVLEGVEASEKRDVGSCPSSWAQQEFSIATPLASPRVLAAMASSGTN